MESFYDNNKRDIAEAAARAQQQAQSASDAKRAELEQRQKNLMSGGYTLTEPQIRTQEEINAGIATGKRLFSEDPKMKELEARRQELSKGYSGQELAALRGLSRDELEGQRAKALQQLRSNLGRGGVGGARGAAIQNQSNIAQQRAAGETERKMLLDSAQLQRQGTGDLQDFLFRQKLGEAGFGIGTAQLGSAERAADASRAANVAPEKSNFEKYTGLGWLLGNVF